MLRQTAIGIGALIITALTAASSANAHTPQKARAKLQDQGFYQISFTDRQLPTFKLRACKGSSKFRVHMNYFGDITLCERVGRCNERRFDDRRIIDSNSREDDYRVPYRYRTLFGSRYRNRFGRRYRDENTIGYRSRY